LANLYLHEIDREERVYDLWTIKVHVTNLYRKLAQFNPRIATLPQNINALLKYSIDLNQLATVIKSISIRGYIDNAINSRPNIKFSCNYELNFSWCIFTSRHDYKMENLFLFDEFLMTMRFYHAESANRSLVLVK